MMTDNYVSLYDVLQAEHTIIAERHDWLNKRSDKDGERVAYVMGVNDMAEALRDQIEKRSAAIMSADVIKDGVILCGGDQC